MYIVHFPTYSGLHLAIILCNVTPKIPFNGGRFVLLQKYIGFGRDRLPKHIYVNLGDLGSRNGDDDKYLQVGADLSSDFGGGGVKLERGNEEECFFK